MLLYQVSFYSLIRDYCQCNNPSVHINIIYLNTYTNFHLKQSVQLLVKMHQNVNQPQLPTERMYVILGGEYCGG